MSATAVFFRTLMKTSAIFIGTAIVFLHPPLDSTSSRRVTAVQSGAESVIDALTGALKDSDAGVRREAAAALGHRSSRRAVPALLGALKDADAQVRVRVISALGEIGDSAAVDGLIGVLRDANGDVRRRAARALGEIGDARAMPALTAALKDEDAMVRRYAVRAIAEIEETMRRARTRSRDRSHNRAPFSTADMAATFALMLPLLIACGDAPAQARPDARQLVTQLSSADPQLRAKAACGLRELGDEAAGAVDALVALLSDGAPIPMTVCEVTHSSWIGRRNAAWALGAIDDPPAVNPLVQALKDSEARVRRQAAWAIGVLSR